LLFLGVAAGLLAPAGATLASGPEGIAEQIRNGWRLAVETFGNLLHTSLREQLGAIERALRQHASQIASQVAARAVDVARLVMQTAFTLLATFFLLKDGKEIFRKLLRWAPRHHAAPITAVGSRIWHALSRYIRGVAIVASFNAVMKTIALLIIGIPYVVPIALLTFIGSFVPFAGPVIATAVAALVAVAHGGITEALLVLLAGIFIQAIEGNILQPYILGRTMHFHPLVILIAVSAGAVLLGLPGAFLAVPLLAALRATAGEWHEASSSG
jgi:predicted PurR-regulated permease PerM